MRYVGRRQRTADDSRQRALSAVCLSADTRPLRACRPDGSAMEPEELRLLEVLACDEIGAALRVDEIRRAVAVDEANALVRRARSASPTPTQRRMQLLRELATVEADLNAALEVSRYLVASAEAGERHLVEPPPLRRRRARNFMLLLEQASLGQVELVQPNAYGPICNIMDNDGRPAAVWDSV